MKYLLLNINATNKWIYLELNHISFMIEVALIVKINFIICGTCVCSVNISFIFYFHFFFLGLLFLGLKKNKIWIKWSQRCAPGGCIHTPLTEVYSLLIQPLRVRSNKVNPIQIECNVRKNTNSFEKAFNSKAHWQIFFTDIFVYE